MTLRWPVVAALLVLAGLFGMHGLGDHGMGDRGMAEAPLAAHAGMAMSAPGASAAPGSALVDDVAGTPTADQPGPAGGHGSMAAMAGMCLAILIGASLALALVRRAPRRTSWVVGRATRQSGPRPRGRAPDPPCLARLSVLRC